MSDAAQGNPSNEVKPATEVNPTAGPGRRLAGIRQERGLTIEQVASQLNLAPRQVAALESDNYAALPGMVIVRGFVRAYAKLLKVDADPLVAMLAEEVSPTIDAREMSRTLASPFSESTLPTMKPKAAIRARTGALFALLVLAAGAVVAWQSGWLNSLTEPGIAAVEQSHQSSAPMKSASQPTPAEPAPVVAQSSSAASNPASQGNQAPSMPAQEAKASPLPAVSASIGALAQQAATSSDSKLAATPSNLVLVAREDSWVELKSADKKVIISRIMKAGTSEAVEINQPGTLVIGNAAGVDLTWRGKPVELKAVSKTNVARVEIK